MCGSPHIKDHNYNEFDIFIDSTNTGFNPFFYTTRTKTIVKICDLSNKLFVYKMNDSNI